MSDNTVLNSGTGGDTIRDLDRTTGASVGAKTQVMQLDIGGANTNAEALATGQTPADTLAANVSLPTVSYNMVWNGTTWNRMVEGSPAGDADSGATTGSVAAECYLRAFNGTTWDRLRTSGSLGGLLISGQSAAAAAITGYPVRVGGTYTSTLPTYTTGQQTDLQTTSRGEVLASLSNAGTAVSVIAASTQPAFTNPALAVADRSTGASGAAVPSSIQYCGATFTTTQPTVSNGNMIGLQTTSRAELLVSISNGATAVPVVAASTANATANAALSVALSPNSPMPATTSSTQACSTGLASALTVLNIKASAGNVMGLTVQNTAASTIFIQFYNTAGTPTLGTSVVWWVPVAASATLVIHPGSFALANHATGIGIGASTTATSTGTPASAPNVVVFYK